jgi:hypothetical protein
LHGQQVRRACLRRFPLRRFLVSLLCGLEDARHVAVKLMSLEKTRKKLAEFLTNFRLEK